MKDKKMATTQDEKENNTESQNKKSYKTMIELKEALIEESKKRRKVMQLKGMPNRQINENDIKRIILKVCDILFIDYSEEKDMSTYTYGIFNPMKNIYERNSLFLKQLIEIIIEGEDIPPKITSHNAAKVIDDSILAMRTEGIKVANLPPNYIIKFKNCIVNLKTKEIYDFDDDEIKDYDFIDHFNYNLSRLKDVDQNMLQIVKKVFRLWSQNVKDVELFIKQLFFAYLDGDGRNKYIILQSDGGDGKSTAMRMIRKIGAKDLTHHANLDEFDNDNIMNQIQPTTRFILGDDLAGNFHLSKKLLSRFKTLIDGGYINVDEKFMPAKLVQCRGLKIQATNTELKVFENNPAIQDRIIYVRWPNYNFRRHPIEDFDLDELSGKYGPPNTAFMEALISFIIFTVEYFTEFSVTEKMKSDFNELLDSADTVKQHVNELKDEGLFENSTHIPVYLLYEHFKQWLNTFNPGAKPLKYRDYTKRVKPILEDKGYENTKQQRISAIKKNQLDLSYFDELYYDDSKRSIIYIKEYNVDLEQLEKDLDELDNEQIKNKYIKEDIIYYINSLTEENQTSLLMILSRLDLMINEKEQLKDKSYDELLDAIH